MIFRETVRPCERCAATTPHAVEVHASRWAGTGVAVGLPLGALLAIEIGMDTEGSVLASWAGIAVLTVGAAFAWAFARGRRCMRCRARREAGRARWVMLDVIEDPHTERFF